MKVVCIILLFGIAAEISSATESVKTKGDAGSQETLGLKFPKFISKPKDFALKLLGICNEHITKILKNTGSNTAINDGKVDFKNCTFYCKYNIRNGHYDNVTLPMPPETPCGPQKSDMRSKR
uniref:Putative secreted salivary protein salp15ir-4 n=1 Tax=Ixodes ricinus TaxID=34613 RepID=V5H033_IXORI